MGACHGKSRSEPIRLTLEKMVQTLRRTPNHKAVGPDKVPSLVLKHMPPAFHEALQLLFQALDITGNIPPSWLQSRNILLYKKGIRRGWTIIAQSP